VSSDIKLVLFLGAWATSLQKCYLLEEFWYIISKIGLWSMLNLIMTHFGQNMYFSIESTLSIQCNSVLVWQWTKTKSIQQCTGMLHYRISEQTHWNTVAVLHQSTSHFSDLHLQSITVHMKPSTLSPYKSSKGFYIPGTVYMIYVPILVYLFIFCRASTTSPMTY
jgi:hypothetical protein